MVCGGYAWQEKQMEDEQVAYVSRGVQVMVLGFALSRQQVGVIASGWVHSVRRTDGMGGRMAALLAYGPEQRWGSWLRRRALCRRVQRTTAGYFDSVLAPEQSRRLAKQWIRSRM